MQNIFKQIYFVYYLINISDIEWLFIHSIVLILFYNKNKN